MYDKNMTPETTARQQAYVDEKERNNQGLGLVFADAFLRGMRDIGYKSPAWALCEMIDNSVQAQAQNVEVIFGEILSEKGGERPGQIAVADDGVGMIPKMISYAVRWGGTDRENDRQGFGRYGYGLPSSAVSLAKRYTVYSKTAGEKWHKVTIDIEELASIAGDLAAIEVKLAPVATKLPKWIIDGVTNVDFAKTDSGTVVVLETLDRLKSGWRTVKTLRAKLLENFGVIYRHWLPEPRLIVDGEAVEPTDPLFLMEHGRYFAETEVMAKKIEARTFTVVSSEGKEAQVTIRASYLPPHFQLADPKLYGRKPEKHNNRFGVMRVYNGLIFCREGRQIDCIQPPSDWVRFVNYDRNIKIEIDFDPLLDEFFGITTAKQQITVDDSMWDRLMNRAKLLDLIRDLRRMLQEDIERLKAISETSISADEERPSEQAMRESNKFKARPHKRSEQQQADGQRNLENEATKISEVTRREREEVIAELEEEGAKRPFKVEWKAVEEGPFYRPVRIGDQKRLIINTNHPFYEKVYNTAGPETKAAIEVLLLVLGESELEAGTAETEQFYKAGRNLWSERLRTALKNLRPDQDVRDVASIAAEIMEVEMSSEGSEQPA